MTSFNTYIAKQYKELNPGMREIYGSLDNFKRLFIANEGFTPWLETLRGKSISLGLTNSIAKLYFEECKRYSNEIPSILASISRQYDVELPVVEGVLNGNYWKAKGEQMGWRMQDAA